MPKLSHLEGVRKKKTSLSTGDDHRHWNGEKTFPVQMLKTGLNLSHPNGGEGGVSGFTGRTQDSGEMEIGITFLGELLCQKG